VARAGQGQAGGGGGTIGRGEIGSACVAGWITAEVGGASGGHALQGRAGWPMCEQGSAGLGRCRATCGEQGARVAGAWGAGCGVQKSGESREE
jgi:hypothetical protein